MSIRLMNRVWDSVPLKGTELNLLLAIADHANEQGLCWPRQERLAERVRCSVRQTRRLLRDLESGGYIAVSDGRGRGKMATIQMNLDLLTDPRNAVTNVRFSEVERVKSSVIDERTSSVTLQENSEAEKRTSDALPFAKASVADNRTCSARENATSGVTFERTASATQQESDAAENRTACAQQNGTSEVTVWQRYSPGRVKKRPRARQAKTEERTSSAQERSPVTANRTSSAPKPDISPHACVEPSKNRQFNHQENQKSVFVATPASRDAFSEVATAHADGTFFEEHSEVSEAMEGQSPDAFESLDLLQDDSSLYEDFIAREMPAPRDLFGTVTEVVKKVAEERSVLETPQQRYFRVLAWIVGADCKTISKEQKGQIAQTMGILQKAGYTEDDLRTFWHTIWRKDWRWTKSRTHPTLTQVRSEIGKLRVDQQEEALALHASTGRDAKGKQILTPKEQEMQKLMREAKERGRLAREAAQNPGVQLPDLSGHEVGLSHRQPETS